MTGAPYRDGLGSAEEAPEPCGLGRSGAIPSAILERVAYSVANSKLGEGPAVRCEGPTGYEINQARQWTLRVFNASGHAELIEALDRLAREADQWSGQIEPPPAALDYAWQVLAKARGES